MCCDVSAGIAKKFLSDARRVHSSKHVLSLFSHTCEDVLCRKKMKRKIPCEELTTSDNRGEISFRPCEILESVDRSLYTAENPCEKIVISGQSQFKLYRATQCR